MKRIINYISIILLSCFFFSSCASIVHGTRQKVSISTNPAGAIISNGEKTITSPGTIELKRNRDYVLTISKPGYETEMVKVTHVISGAVAGNLLSGGFLGWGVDAISGAQWRLVPEIIDVNLRPLQSGEIIEKSIQPETIETKLANLTELREKNLISEDEYKVMREITLRTEEAHQKNSKK